MSIERPHENGIDARWTSTISDEAQSRLASAFSEMRLVWNNSIEMFQVVMESAGCLTVFQDGTLNGWEIIGEFAPPLDLDLIISTLRGRQNFIVHKLRKMGYGTETDSNADVLNAYLDDADNVVQKAVDQLYDDAVDDYMDGPMARARDEGEIMRKRIIRLGDLNSGSRAHTPTKLIVPANPNGVSRLLRAKQ